MNSANQFARALARRRTFSTKAGGGRPKRANTFPNGPPVPMPWYYNPRRRKV